MTYKQLADLLGESEDEIRNALIILREKLEYRGLAVIEQNNMLMLGTNPEASELIEKLRKEELSKDLGKAALETLAIILYKGPISRADIDYIRGVNSTFILRNLMIRGLTERIPHPTDARSFLYQPTIELFSFLGITTIEELPEFDALRAKIDQFTDEEKADERN